METQSMEASFFNESRGNKEMFHNSLQFGFNSLEEHFSGLINLSLVMFSSCESSETI